MGAISRHPGLVSGCGCPIGENLPRRELESRFSHSHLLLDLCMPLVTWLKTGLGPSDTSGDRVLQQTICIHLVGVLGSPSILCESGPCQILGGMKRSGEGTRYG